MSRPARGAVTGAASGAGGGPGGTQAPPAAHGRTPHVPPPATERRAPPASAAAGRTPTRSGKPACTGSQPRCSWVTVVIATRNRRPDLLRTLARLRELPERPPVIVVDNGSTDGTAEVVRERCPGVWVVPLRRNAGAAARNEGTRLARSPYVAFCDDDSWWQPGALAAAAAVLDGDPRLGLIAAQTVVGPSRRPDPVNAAMARSPLRDRGEPEVLGFLACACVIRREAFLGVGGFSELLFFVGEERLLAYDLAAAGWGRRYLPEAVAVHEPSSRRPEPRERQRAERRNLLLTAWLRRPAAVAAGETLRLAHDAARDPVARAALAGALRRLPAALRRRRRLPPGVERKVRVLAAAQGGSW